MCNGIVKIEAFVYSLKVVDSTKSDWLLAYLIDNGERSLPGETIVGFEKSSICKDKEKTLTTKMGF